MNIPFQIYETDQIHFSFWVKVADRSVYKRGLNVDLITSTILLSPWNGNQPLIDCLKPGQHYNWGFNLESSEWLDWEFTLKPTLQKKDCVRVVKQAIQGFIEINELAA